MEAAQLCHMCSATLSSYSNLKRHYKKVHGSELIKERYYTCQCKTCGKKFSANKFLNRHIKLKHATEFAKKHVVKKHVAKKIKLDDKATTEHKYADGNETAVPTDGQQPVFKLRKEKPAMKACPHCDLTFKMYQELEDHLILVHDFVMEVEKLKFKSKEEFLSWKRAHEAETLSSFVIRSSGQGYTSYYICHRAGVPRCKSSTKMQWATTHKIGKCCPARMKVIYKENSTAIKVVFHRTHSGHTQSIKSMHLSKDERCMLAGKIKNGVPSDNILDDVRDSVSSRGEMTRLHLLEKQDLRNILKEFDLDRDSAQYREDSPVIYYKRQNHSDSGSILKEEDFMIVIMTKYQIEGAKSYASQKLLIDSTHGTAGCDFQLTTIVSVDEFGAGTPIAECISNRIDADAMGEFFRAVKSKTGIISSKVFMSDDFPAYYNAWSDVMEIPENKLLCIWHVDKAWRNNISDITNKIKQAEVYRMCTLLLEITNKCEFLETMKDFIRSCASDTDTSEFGKYFDKYYASRPEQWAYCYRAELGLNTNIYLEAMHKRPRPECKVCVNRSTCACVDYLSGARMCKHIHACIHVAQSKTSQDVQSIINDEAFLKDKGFAVETLKSGPNARTHIGEGASPYFKIETMLNAMLDKAKTLSYDAAQTMSKEIELCYEKMQAPTGAVEAKPDILPKFNVVASSSHVNV